jgi:HK97 family phage major capsid protein
MTVAELRQKQQKLVADARAKLEEIKDDTPEARAKEIEAEYDRIMAEYDAIDRRATQIEQIESREAALASAMSRRPAAGEDRSREAIELPHERGNERETPEKVAEARAKAFRTWLRYGDSYMTREERAMLVRAPRDGEQRAFGGEGTGGADFGYGQYLVPQGFMAELVQSLKAWGPMLDAGVARQMVTASGNSIPWPTMDDTSNQGALIAENAQVTLSEIDFGTKNLEAYKYTSGVVLVSSELLQDAAVDVEQIVRDAMAERVARKANADLTTADGSSKPHGIVTAASLGTTAASATAITFDEVMNLEHSVDPAYRALGSCRWMFNDSTLKALRQLKDGQGRYIWQPPDMKAGQPATLLNYPYSINQAMASIATGNRTIVFGAFEKYVVRIVNQFAIRRLVERYADFDQVGFIGFSRIDGELLDTAAVKYLAQA